MEAGKEVINTRWACWARRRWAEARGKAKQDSKLPLHPRQTCDVQDVQGEVNIFARFPEGTCGIKIGMQSPGRGEVRGSGK